MRLLVILSLLLSTLTMAMPSSAQAEVPDCHALNAMSDDHVPAGQQDQPLGKSAHMCPGCALFAQSADDGNAPLHFILAHRISGTNWRVSIKLTPIPPPPRNA